MKIDELLKKRDELVKEKQEAVKKLQSTEAKHGKAFAELQKAKNIVVKLTRRIKALRAEIQNIPAHEMENYHAELEAKKKKATVKKEEKPKEEVIEEPKEEETKEIEKET